MHAIFRVAVLSVGALIIAGLLLLKFFPPELTRVGANYTAKIVCTNVFMNGRDPQQVLRDDVQVVGHPILRWMSVDVDRDNKVVRANLFGIAGRGLAVWRPGTGCAAVPDGDIARARSAQFAPVDMPVPSPQAAWPAGAAANVDAAIEKLLQDDELTGTGMRAVVVIHDGRLVAERYAKGFDRNARLLGWSLAKTVNAALVGIQIRHGMLRLDQNNFWPDAGPSDPRQKIRLADLLSMTSGLAFEEEYGAVSDVTRMLYLTPDMNAYVQSKPLVHPVGTVWNYSSGTSVMLSHLWQRSAGSGEASLTLPERELFSPLGMSSAVMEADEAGTMVGGSYMYATAQDWARFGQFLLQDGVWGSQRILPEGFVAMMMQPAPGSDGRYGMGQIWREGPGHDHPDRTIGLPDRLMWLQGHDGQSMVLDPARQLIVLRLGLTPARYHYQPQHLLANIIRTIDSAHSLPQH